MILLNNQLSTAMFCITTDLMFLWVANSLNAVLSVCFDTSAFKWLQLLLKTPADCHCKGRLAYQAPSLLSHIFSYVLIEARVSTVLLVIIWYMAQSERLDVVLTLETVSASLSKRTVIVLTQTYLIKTC